MDDNPAFWNKLRTLTGSLCINSKQKELKNVSLKLKNKGNPEEFYKYMVVNGNCFICFIQSVTYILFIWMNVKIQRFFVVVVFLGLLEILGGLDG